MPVVEGLELAEPVQEVALVPDQGAVYAVFLLVMAFAGKAVARLFRLDAGAGRAIVFTGATRNSLVVLPLALALPDALAVAAVVVVTQTLVEVLGMVAYVRLVPRLLPTREATAKEPAAF